MPGPFAPVGGGTCPPLDVAEGERVKKEQGEDTGTHADRTAPG